MKTLKVHYGKKGSIEGSKTRLIKMQVSTKEEKGIIRKTRYIKAYSPLHAAEKVEKKVVEKRKPFFLHISKIEVRG